MVFCAILPIHDTSTAVIFRDSLGFISLLRPVKAEITTVGYETDTPMSKSNNVVTELTIICRRFAKLNLNIYIASTNECLQLFDSCLHTCGRYLRRRLCSTLIFAEVACSMLFIFRSCLKLKCPIMDQFKTVSKATKPI